MRSSKLQIAFGACLTAALAACGSSGGSGDGAKPPSGLSYSVPAAVYVRGVKIAANHPTVSGKVKEFWAEPALPAGLALDGQTGVITGAPTTATELGAYTVFAKNSVGTTSTTLNLGVALPTRFAIVGHAVDRTLSVHTLDPASGDWRPRGFKAQVAGELDLRAIAAHPSGEFVYVANEGSNSIGLYRLDSSTGELAHGGDFATGAAPASVVFDDGGCHAYVLCRVAASVETFAIDATTGALAASAAPVVLDGGPQALRLHPHGLALYVAETGQSRVQALSIDPLTHAPSALGASHASGQTPVDLEVDPLGRFLYTSNLRGHNVSIFALAADGSLVPEGALATGIFPSDVAIDPTGRFLHVCESGNDRIRSFSIDPLDGSLEEVGTTPAFGERPIALGFDAGGERLYALDIDGNRTWRFDADPTTGALTLASEYVTRDLPQLLALVPGETAAAPRPRFAYVANSGSQDVSAYAADPVTGVLTSITPSVIDQGSPRVALSAPNGRFVYTLNAGTNDVHPFAVDPVTGNIHAQGARLPLSGAPTSGVIDASGRFLYALLGGDDRIDAFSIDPATGTVTALGSTTTDAGPAALAVDSTGRFLYVANYAADTISFLRIDPHTGALTPGDVELIVPGRPRSLVCHPDGRHLYAVLEQGATAVRFTISPYNGELSEPEAQVTGALPVSIAIDARGRFAYTANRSFAGVGDIGGYRIDAQTGDLEPLGSVLGGLGPIALLGDPSGRFLYAVNEDDDTITIFGVHQANGHLTIGTTVSTGVAPRSLAIIGALE
ncbi:MAG: lactonase family protein [Planctomycetes bacterium]|nr:lactonase family protein [Planctomycetota bacterium]